MTDHSSGATWVAGGSKRVATSAASATALSSRPQPETPV